MDAFALFEEAGWRARAADYDRMIGHITGRVVDPLLDAAGVTAGSRVLDLACGPGYAAARAAGRGARPVGVDLSPAMVALARARHPGVDFREAPADALPFPAAAFDAVVANFLLPHLAEPSRTVAECARVLTAGGRLALTTWAVPARARFVGVLVDAIAEVAPEVPADLPSGPPFFRYADSGVLTALLESGGFTGAEVITVTFDHRVGGPDELWHGLLDGTVRTSALVLAQPAAVRDRIRAAFDRLVAPYARGDGLALPVAAVLAKGVKNA